MLPEMNVNGRHGSHIECMINNQLIDRVCALIHRCFVVSNTKACVAKDLAFTWQSVKPERDLTSR